MAISIVGTPQAEGNTASANSIQTSAANHTAGNALIAFTILNFGTVVDSTIFNTAGDTWQFLTDTFVDDISGNRILGFYTPSTNGNAADQITFPITSSVIYRAVVVFEVSGQSVPSFDDGAALASGGLSTTTAITPTIGVSAAQDIICCVGVHSNGSSVTPDNGATGSAFAITGDANTYYWYQYHVVNGSGSESATLGSTSTWGMSGASFKEASGAAKLFRTNPLAGLGSGGPFFQNPLNYPMLRGFARG